MWGFDILKVSRSFMKFIRMCTIVLARFFIGLIFLSAVINKILNWHDTEKLLANQLCEWQTHLGFFEAAQNCLAMLTPWTPLLLITATLFEILGGLLVILGVKEKLGATLLVLFLVPTTIIMHPFWFEQGAVYELQTIMFLKNLAILGGLLLIIVFGAQAKSSSGGDPFQTIKLG